MPRHRGSGSGKYTSIILISKHPVSQLRLSPSMDHDFSRQFNILREEFRLLTNEVKIKSVMDEPALNSSWLMPAMFHASIGGKANDPFSASSSSHLSPFKSSEPSHSPTESETAQSDEPKVTTFSGSDDVEAPPQWQAQSILEPDKNSLVEPTVTKQSRKGHRKSREGCFNCKRRKIKVYIRLKLIHCLT